MTSQTILLTGLPRSGTTLVCRLLNGLDDTVALVEPMAVGGFAGLPSRAAILDEIERFAEAQRATLRRDGHAVTRHVEGEVSDNLFAAKRAADGLRPFHAEHGAIRFDKPLSPDAKLVIKHPAAFTALLPELAQRFSCFAIVRNPLSALASWNSTKMPINDGRAPAAEQLDDELHRALSTISDRFERQLHLMNWYFGRYHDHLSRDRVLRYEDIAASGGAALAAILPEAGALREPLENRNRSGLYDWSGVAPLAERLFASEGPCWQFYSRDEARALLG